jgi:hypothetical protein
MVEMFYFFLNILIGFEIFAKLNLLPELGLAKYTQAEKKTSFSDFFEICCTVLNVAKGNKIAKTGLKNVFFIH